MPHRTTPAFLLLLASCLGVGCSEPPGADAGSGGTAATGGASGGGTGAGPSSGGADGDGGTAQTASGGGVPGSGGIGSGGQLGAGGFGGEPEPVGECEVPLGFRDWVLGQWVLGEQPEPLGGPIQPGIYDLTAYQDHTTNLPDDIHLGFSTEYAVVVEFGSDGSYRSVQGQSDIVLVESYTATFSTNGPELVIAYDCPNVFVDPRPYTAMQGTVLLYDGLGYEYVLTRRAD